MSDLEHPDRLAVVALSFRRVGFGPLGALALPAEGAAELVSIHAALGVDDLAYLSTCNRVECYVWLRRGQGLEDLATRALKAFRARGVTLAREVLLVAGGEDAAHHLLSVASGLDSLVLGETEISGQARRALDRAAAAGVAGPALTRAFERAAACSRRVKVETALGRTPASAATIALQKVGKYFGESGPGVSVLVGAGEMTRKVARALASRPGERIFVNRTRARAEALAREFGGVARSLDELIASPPARIDLLFSATSATSTVIPASALAPALASRGGAGASTPLVVCDLGLPRDVDPAVDALPGVLVVDMRAIEASAASAQRASEAELVLARRIVTEEAARWTREETFRRLADESARALLDGGLRHLGDEDRELIARFAVGLGARFARQPA